MTTIESRSPCPKRSFADFDEPDPSSPQPGTTKRLRIETVEAEQAAKVCNVPSYQSTTNREVRADYTTTAKACPFKASTRIIPRRLCRPAPFESYSEKIPSVYYPVARVYFRIRILPRKALPVGYSSWSLRRRT